MLARIRTSAQEKDQGFTLIELLVVMIIIGILAAIAVPAYTNQRKKAYDTSAKSDVANVATEIQSYLVDNAATAVTINTHGSTFGGGTGEPAGLTTNVTSTSTVIGKITATGTFTVCGYSGSGTTTATSAWVFDSANGGLQANKTACP